MDSFRIELQNKDEVIKWLKKVQRGSGDARPLWLAVIPKLTEFVEYEFHDTRDAHKIWPSLSPSYKNWKVKHGFSSGMGVLTGTMREAASSKSIKKLKPKSLTWQLNESLTMHKGFSYASVFHKGNKKGTQPARPVYKYTAQRLNSFLSFDVKKFKEGSHNSFTYSWLRKSLEPN